jgi:hypothetical protein
MEGIGIDLQPGCYVAIITQLPIKEAAKHGSTSFE